MKTKLVLLSIIMIALFTGASDMSPDFYFNSWEASRENQDANGMFFVVDDYYLTFSIGEAAALHEVGHIRDVEQGWPSQSEGFQNAMNEYCETADMEATLGWRVCHEVYYSEAYAELYMWNILYKLPLEFEDFY